MEPNEPGSFDSTRWTLIEQVQGDSQSGRREALEELLTRYVPALRAHLIMRRRLQPQDAADLVQDFVTNKILERDLVSRADRTRGKFRGFLLTALDRFVVDWIRFNRAKKRAAPDVVAIDGDRCDPAAGETADVFDIAWGQTVLGEALKRMRQSCLEDDSERIWTTFELRVLRPLTTGAQPLDYLELVRKCGFESPRQASNALITARRRFTRCLRQVVAEYTTSDEEITEEIGDLQRILSAEEAWKGEVQSPDLAAIIDSSDTESDIEGTLGRDAAGLLTPSPVPHPDWGSQDLGPILRHLLAAPLLDVLLWLEVPAPTADWATRPTGDLFVDPHPPLELLEEAKRTGQQWAKEEGGAMPHEVGTTIYFVSIAVALIRLGKRISRSPDATLKSGFEKLAHCSWMEPGLGDLLRRGLEVLAE